jgi:hypothetical protein
MKKSSQSLDRYIDLIYTIITVNKSPLKGGLTFFLFSLIGIFCSIIIRLNYQNKINLDFSNLGDVGPYIFILIGIISLLFSYLLVFKTIINTSHALNLITKFRLRKYRRTIRKKDLRFIKIGYYLNYFYNVFVTSIIVVVNYCFILNINFYNGIHFFYLASLLILVIFTIYFIKYKMPYEAYNLSKKLKFSGKCIFVSLMLLFILYIYSIYNGTFIKIFNTICPFETIYCESGSSSVEKDLSNLESKEGTIITSKNNSPPPLGPGEGGSDKNLTNFNESSNNSNAGNNNNNLNQQPSTCNNTDNNNDSLLPVGGSADNMRSSITTTSTNITTANLLSTQITPDVEYSQNHLNSNQDQLENLDSSSSTPTPNQESNDGIVIHSKNKCLTTTNSNNLETSYKSSISQDKNGIKFADNTKSKSKFPNWKFDLNLLDNITNITNDISSYIFEKDEIDLVKLNKFEPYYGNISKFKLLYNIQLNNNTDFVYLKYILENSFSSSYNLLKELLDQKYIDIDDFNKYVKWLIGNSIMQSSESNSILRTIPQNLFLNLENELDGKSIFLNGKNSYFKTVEINSQNLTVQYDLIGLNNFEFINHLLFLIEDTETEQDLLALEYLKNIKFKEFKDKHNITFTHEISKYLLYPDLINNPIFKDYHNGTNNLIFQYKFGNFMLKYTDGDKITNKIINCDSLHKLIYWMKTEQNLVLKKYSEICNHYDWKKMILRKSNLISDNIFKKIELLNNDYNNLLHYISTLDNTSVDEEDSNIQQLAKKYSLNDMLKNNETPDNSFVDSSTWKLIINRISKKELIEILERQNINIELRKAIKKDIPGLDTKFIENQYNE